MFKLFLTFLVIHNINANLIHSIEYGGKIPSEGPFDIGFTYTSETDYTCRVSLIDSFFNEYACTETTITINFNTFTSVTLASNGDETIPIGSFYSIRFQYLNRNVVYFKQDFPVRVESGRQGFYVDGNTIYDANKNPFLIRGVNIYFINFSRSRVENSIPAISETSANSVRLNWRKDITIENITDFERTINTTISYNMIPIVSLHDATCSNSTEELVQCSNYWVNNMNVLIKYRKYLIINIANEWSAPSLQNDQLSHWRRSYDKAISVFRNAGYSGLLMIDTAGCGQNPYGVIQNANDILSYDPFSNLAFAVHMYWQWSTANTRYSIQKEFPLLEAQNIAFVIGEFSIYVNTTLGNGSVAFGPIDTIGIMRSCLKKNYNCGFIAWCWNGNTQNQMNMSANSNWTIPGQYTEWGKQVIFTEEIGFLATSEKATVF